MCIRVDFARYAYLLNITRETAMESIGEKHQGGCSTPERVRAEHGRLR